MKLSKYHFYLAAIVWCVWLSYMFWMGKFYLFIDNWFVSVIMVFGSFVAGATSEGSGAITFPILTLLFNIHPFIARNFSLAIQSIGMTSASFIIYKLRIPVEKKAILFASLGGVVGIVFGSFFVAPFIPPKMAKIFFVSLWLAFGFALLLINKKKEREIYKTIHNFKNKDKIKLCLIGIMGGIFSSIFGTGICIITFSFLTLYYKISEKVATPTSVVLMAINAVAGFLLHVFILRDFQSVAFNYWIVAIPVVVIFAPLGAMYINNRSRGFIANFLITTIVIEFIGAFIILRPNFSLIIFSLIIFGLGSLLFWRISLANNYINYNK
jgi:uncharacterized membrane protein YfcA